MKTNYILALIAVLGGLTAAFTSHSVKNDLYPTWLTDSERIKGGKVDYISATHLADLLYQKNQVVVVLDVRAEEDYVKYHIPSASLYEKDMPEQDLKKLVYVVYGLESEKEVLELKDEFPAKVYVLKGGLEAWRSLVLFPDFAQYKVRNREALEHIIRRSKYYGGSPGNTQVLNIEVRQNNYREGC